MEYQGGEGEMPWGFPGLTQPTFIEHLLTTHGAPHDGLGLEVEFRAPNYKETNNTGHQNIVDFQASLISLVDCSS